MCDVNRHYGCGYGFGVNSVNSFFTWLFGYASEASVDILERVNETKDTSYELSLRGQEIKHAKNIVKTALVVRKDFHCQYTFVFDKT